MVQEKSKVLLDEKSLVVSFLCQHAIKKFVVLQCFEEQSRSFKQKRGKFNIEHLIKKKNSW